MATLWHNIRYKVLQSGSKVNLLIFINVAVFLIINIPAVLGRFILQNDAITIYTRDYLDLSAYLPKLATRFWTPVTYMFMHEGIFHILFNMLWLYWLGQIFEEYLGNKRTIGLYIMGGLAGALFYLLAFNLIPAYAHPEILSAITLAGASASVMAIIVATATLLPDYTIFMMFIGPVKLKWLALFFVILDFLTIDGLNAGGEIAHLGGALLGFVFIRQLQKGHDWSRIGDLFRAKPKSKLKVVSRSTGKKVQVRPRQDEIDRILDKISQSGVDSLTKVEKDILSRASNHDEG
jgi:membrane associated rhomboid family serine protease